MGKFRFILLKRGLETLRICMHFLGFIDLKYLGIILNRAANITRHTTQTK